MSPKSKKSIDDMSIFDDMKNLLSATDGIKAYKDARLIDIKLIKPNPEQPRTSMNQEKLEELAQSIEDMGLMQPIVVRPEGEIYRIIAGHRRFAAWSKVSSQPIPCIVRDTDELKSLEQSLIENIQREKLDEVDEARYYRTLIDELGYTMETLAQRLHKSLGYIDSRLKLLRHDNVARAVKQGKIGIFEAREVAKIDDDKQRAELLSMLEKDELDRDGLKQEVKRATGKNFQQLKIDQLTKMKKVIKGVKLDEFKKDDLSRLMSVLKELQSMLARVLKDA